MKNTDPSLVPGPTELSAEDIERAHNAESDNPIFGLLQEFQDLMQDYQPESSERRDEFVEALIDASPYEIDAKTIIAIWAYGLDNPRESGMAHAFSRPLFAVFVLYDPSRPETADIARRNIEADTLEGIDEENIRFAQNQLRKIVEERQKISIYIDGIPNATEKVVELSRSNDPDDIAEMEEIIERGRQRRTPVLFAVGENIPNATLGLAMQLEFEARATQESS